MQTERNMGGEMTFNIKQKNRNKAIRAFIDLSHTIKEIEYLNGQWLLKLFGIYKLQNYFNQKIKKANEK